MLVVLGSIFAAIGSKYYIWKAKPGNVAVICWTIGLLFSIAGLINQLATTHQIFTLLKLTSRLPMPTPCFAFYTVVSTTSFLALVTAIQWIQTIRAVRSLPTEVLMLIVIKNL